MGGLCHGRKGVWGAGGEECIQIAVEKGVRTQDSWEDPKYQTGEKPRDHRSGLRKEGDMLPNAGLSPRAVPRSKMAFQGQHWETLMMQSIL